MEDEDTNVTINDLAGYAIDHKPIEFSQAFDTLLRDKLSTAIEDKKLEIAQRMFVNSEPNEEEE